MALDRSKVIGHMAACVRRLFSILLGLCKCISTFLLSFTGRRGSCKDTPPSTAPNSHDWRGEEWEDFSVAVIPNPDTTKLEEQETEVDVFSGMQPVIKKAKKVGLQYRASSSSQPQDWTQSDLC